MAVSTPSVSSLSESQVMALVIFACVVGAFMIMKANEQSRQRQWEFQKEQSRQRQWEFQKEWNEMGTRIYKEFRR